MKLLNGRLNLAATDLSNHVSCAHLTNLNHLAANGTPPGARSFDPLAIILAERGRAHEAAYIEHLRAQGLVIEGGLDAEDVTQLMERGVDVIVQARLENDRWTGRPDFLVRVEKACNRWPWSYEVVDAKLATETRAGTVLQLCFYSDLLGAIQGELPDRMHVVKPGFARETFRYDEYAGIYRLLRDDLAAQVGEPPDSYPQPVPHCDICEWRSHCVARRREDDHLSLVADLRRQHIRDLNAVGIKTVRALSEVAAPWPFEPARGLKTTYERLAHQARLQIAARVADVPPFELLPPVHDRGLARLPQPSPLDVFLDLEGDAFIGDSGREFLFGFSTAADDYQALWATSDEEERRAFESLIDRLVQRLDEDSTMHIYHFAAYEQTALKRLSCRYGTRNDELDRLLRGKRFIDLHSITRQALRAGVESYGLKSLEPIYGFRRALDLESAGVSLRAIRLALQRGTPSSIEAGWQHEVELYNRDDCDGARALRAWLEELRATLVLGGASIERPPLRSGEQESIPEKANVASATAAALLAGIEAGREQRSTEENARWLLGHLLDWYRREARAAWWEFFRLANVTDVDRVDEQRALAGMELLDRRETDRAVFERYRFPHQDFMLSDGEALWVDEDTQIGTLVAIDASERIVEIRRKVETLELTPASVFAHTIVAPMAKRQALLSIASDVAKRGFEPDDRGAPTRDLLFQLPPRGSDGLPLRRSSESLDECVFRLAGELRDAVLPIQGPPGTGKTEVAAKMIVALVVMGKRVGVTATSHAVIENLVSRAIRIATAAKIPIKALVKSDDPEAARQAGIEYTSSASQADKKVKSVHLLGATPWQWARESMNGAVDVLFIDEAGQMSLADAVAVSRSARSIVLVGDPQQLEQPILGTHPEGLDVSVLQHLLLGRDTIRPERGLFLEETYRLHPRICSYTSEQFYERRLRSANMASQQDLRSEVLPAPGLYWAPVEHIECINRSPAEAHAIARLVQRLLSDDSTWTSGDVGRARLTARDILIVAPFNAHVSVIRDVLNAAGIREVRVGTVDKFQGQEAAVAIYSMASSSPEDAPRGMSFLYNRHRLNVATSRARCASVLVCAPSLLRPRCETPRHLHLASALCRYVELATKIELTG